MARPIVEAWRHPDQEVRVFVDRWLVCERIDAQFIERPRSVRMVWHYLRRIGPVEVWRKVRSRLAETDRNDKIIGIGIGRVTDTPEGSALIAGQPVLFVAPNHSSRWQHLCLDTRLLVAYSGGEAEMRSPTGVPVTLKNLAGWSPYAGRPLDAEAIRAELRRLAGEPTTTVPGTLTQAPPAGLERRDNGAASAGRKSAVVFGLGNYAKTLIVPSIGRYLELRTVHEVDPDQIATAAGFGVTLDTSPGPRPGERHDAWFIAGFHHTHADLAKQALDDGAYAVVEKPLVTTRAQLESLESTLARQGSRKLFTCFQKRYSPWNGIARADLGVAEGDAIDMHCIVYEVPLPVRHWYNWPNSGSRLISNGCHWLDYFMFMNGYSAVRDYEVIPLRGGDLVATATLDNGAQLVLSLTDTGSERLGMREVIDLRSGNATVRITDSSRYEAENTTRMLRRLRGNPLSAYQIMYASISQTIAAGGDGDSLNSLRSSRLMIDLEEMLAARRAATRPA